MSEWFAFTLVIASLAASASSDYVIDRKAAVALVAARKYDEALAAFIRMSEYAETDLQKSDALQQAALCADALKQPDRAAELARKIPLAPVSKTCLMQILENGGQWQEIVDKFKDEDFDTWPERLRGDACLRRGYAYQRIKNGAAAASDFNHAAEYITDLNTKGYCLNLLGDTYRFLLQDDDRAVSAYRKTYAAGNIYKHCQAAINIADILRQQKKYAAAVEEFRNVDMEQVMAPFWRGSLLCAQAQALGAAGRKAEAIATCQAALQLKDLPDEARKRCEAALKELKPEAK